MKLKVKQQSGKYNKKIYYGKRKRKEAENQVVCSSKQASELMNLVSCGWWPGENEQFRLQPILTGCRGPKNCQGYL